MGLLRRWDEHNQGVVNWLMDHPDAGNEVLPYAKSPQARRLLIGLSVGLSVLVPLGFVVGWGAWVAWVVGVIVCGVVARRLEHHPGRDRYGHPHAKHLRSEK